MKFSKIISYFFHPINFPIAGALLYFLLLPKHIFKPQEHLILIVIFIGTYVFPLVLLFMLRYFKMIHSYHMVTIEERKFPTLLFISISFIFGNWVLKTTVVDLLALFYFGYMLCLTFTYLFYYINLKISLHTAAIGGLLGFFLFFSYHYSLNLILLLAVLFVLSGIIASARLKLQAHKLSEIVVGYFLGILTQFIVYFIYIM